MHVAVAVAVVVFVECVQCRRSGAVDIEPPVADEEALIEERAVGAQEGRLALLQTHVEHLNVRHDEINIEISILMGC